MENKNNGVTADDRGSDDFYQIHGLGEKSIAALHNNGIFHYADLAGFTPKILAKMLHKAGVQIYAKTIEKGNWIGQAKELAKRQAISPELEDVSASRSNSEWREHAYFSWTFESRDSKDGQKEWQMRVYREQNGGDKIETKLPCTIEPTAWVNWILEKANLPEEIVPYTAVSPKLPPLQEPQVTILDISLSDSASRDEAMLAFEIIFWLSGDEAKALAAESAPYQIDAYVIDRESGAENQFDFTENQLHPGKEAYAVRNVFPMPQLGQYKLKSVLTFPRPSGAIIAQADGPTFGVVP